MRNYIQLYGLLPFLLFVSLLAQANPIALPGQIIAANYTAMSGVQSGPSTDIGGGSNLSANSDNSYSDYLVDATTTGVYTFQCRVASANAGGTILVMNGATVLGSITVPCTGGWQTWMTVSGSVNLKAGTQTLRLVYQGEGGNLFNLNWIYVKSQIPTPIANKKGIKGAEKFSSELYPNPVINILTIRTEMEIKKAVILDFSGKVLLENAIISEKQFSMDVSQLPAGAYLLQLQREDGTTSKKFFKL